MRARRFYLASLVSVVVAVAACSGIATQPSESQAAKPSADLIGGLLGGVTKTLDAVLLQCSPLPASSSTVTIGSEGGFVQVGPHILVVPRGALGSRTTITGEVVSGNVNSVRFTPEGLQFRKNAYLTMSYSNCSGLGMLLPKKIVYTTEGLKLLQLLTSLDLSGARLVSAPIGHFSRYAVAY